MPILLVFSFSEVLCRNPPLSALPLFPLPCSSFEKYMLVDDRPSHPMVSFLEAGFQGTVDLDFLRISGARVLERHPLMNACLAGKRMQDWHWVPSRQPLRIQTISSAEELPGIGNELMNLREQAGLQVWVLTEGKTSKMYLQVHHAVADALGMLTFLMEWLVHYQQQVSGMANVSSLSHPGIARLAERENLAGLKSPYPGKDRWKGIVRVFAGKKTAVLRNLASEPNEALSPPQHCTLSIPPAEVDQLKDLARRQKVTIGDCLTLAMFRAIHHWNGPQQHDSMRVVIPVNRRDDQEIWSSASNKISYKYLSRMPEELTDSMQALGSIAEEMAFVRKHRKSIFNFLKTLRVLERTGLTRFVLHSKRSFGTAVFSNLGDISRMFSGLLPEQEGKFTAGNLVLGHLACAPPRRPLTHTTVASFSYAGSLHLCSRGDGRGLNAAETRLFLQEIQTQLQQLVRL